MTNFRTYGLLTRVPMPSRKGSRMEKFGLLKTVCIIFVVCVATAVGSPAQIFRTLHDFDVTDGSGPSAVIQAADGNFYGTTAAGGAYDDGTVFKITPGRVLTTLHDFDLTDGGGPLAGYPLAALAQGTDGNFYGTTGVGGAYGDGTVFKMTPAGTLTTLYTFYSTDNVVFPSGLVQGTDGNFYGTTFGGGAYGFGTVFKVTPAGALTTLYSFNSTDNVRPFPSGLVQGTDGNFYGITQYGGGSSNCSSGCGTVFQISPSGTLTTLHSFDQTDGQAPVAGLVEGADGNFYGTTQYGGGSSNCSSGCGTVFQISPTGTLTTFYNFNSTDGAVPFAGLIQATDGNFYGTTFGEAGKCNPYDDCGTIFKITPARVLTTLHSFLRIVGAGTLLQAADGNFYGTTAQGGQSGSIFELSVFPQVRLSTTSLGFGNQALDEVSAAQTATLTNIGGGTLNITGINASSNFAVSSTTCGATLAAGDRCKVSVTFTPTALGKLTGTLTFSDNASNSPQTVALSGFGVEPATVTPAKSIFNSQAVGTTSAPRIFTLTNNQSVTLKNLVISTTGDFAVSSTTCTTSLAAKGKCTVSVTFTPTATGKRTGQLSVNDDAANSPQTLNLTGTGK